MARIAQRLKPSVGVRVDNRPGDQHLPWNYVISDRTPSTTAGTFRISPEKHPGFRFPGGISAVNVQSLRPRTRIRTISGLTRRTSRAGIPVKRWTARTGTHDLCPPLLAFNYSRTLPSARRRERGTSSPRQTNAKREHRSQWSHNTRDNTYTPARRVPGRRITL